mmetsp:Transcript_38371/g.68561  ORF Transcript_38371/g.68561 Transcript_38371/m.68561 type:complete len:220 (-) Transcript_38371:3200-3859(-)
MAQYWASEAQPHSVARTSARMGFVWPRTFSSYMSNSRTRGSRLGLGMLSRASAMPITNTGIRICRHTVFRSRTAQRKRLARDPRVCWKKSFAPVTCCPLMDNPATSSRRDSPSGGGPTTKSSADSGGVAASEEELEAEPSVERDDSSTMGTATASCSVTASGTGRGTAASPDACIARAPAVGCSSTSRVDPAVSSMASLPWALPVLCFHQLMRRRMPFR